DERDVTRRTTPRPPAASAREEVRPAAAIEQNDRLLAALLDLAEKIARARMKRPAYARHPDDLDRRHTEAIDALGQFDPRQPLARLGPRRRAAADEDGARDLGAALGDVARVVTRIAVLLVRRVVLFVDDDQPHVADRRIDR